MLILVYLYRIFIKDICGDGVYAGHSGRLMSTSRSWQTSCSVRWTVVNRSSWTVWGSSSQQLSHQPSSRHVHDPSALTVACWLHTGLTCLFSAMKFVVYVVEPAWVLVQFIIVKPILLCLSDCPFFIHCTSVRLYLNVSSIFFVNYTN